MANRYSLQDHILDSSDNEGGMADTKTEVSEPGDYNHTSITEEEHQESEEESYEEEGNADQVYQSKSGNITWTTPPPQGPGRASAARFIKLTTGPTRYACSRVEDIKTTCRLE